MSSLIEDLMNVGCFVRSTSDDIIEIISEVPSVILRKKVFEVLNQKGALNLTFYDAKDKSNSGYTRWFIYPSGISTEELLRIKTDVMDFYSRFPDLQTYKLHVNSQYGKVSKERLNNFYVKRLVDKSDFHREDGCIC